MHFHPILLVKAENLEEAKIEAQDFCDCECGERSFFDYGGIVPDEETEWNKPFNEVKDLLPEDDHIEKAEQFLEKADKELERKNHGWAGYYYRQAGALLSQRFCVEYPLYNIQANNYSRDCDEDWYAIEADLHF
jgi:hypothetical protein